MFDYSAVSIIAATDGTLVDIDKNGDGTYETTGIAASAGRHLLHRRHRYRPLPRRGHPQQRRPPDPGQPDDGQ